MQQTLNDILDEEASVRENNPLKKIIGILALLWPWLILSVIICVSLSYLYSKYQVASYRIHASVLVKDDKSSSGTDGSVLEDLGLPLGKNNVDNEVEIFKSRALMQTVVEQKELYIKYYLPGKVSAPSELYQSTSPVILKYVDCQASSIKSFSSFKLAFNQKDATRYELTVKDKVYHSKLGDTLQLDDKRIWIGAGGGFPKWNLEQPVIINTLPFDNAVREYMSRLSILIPNKQASIIYLTLVEDVPQKGEMALNALINAYLQASVNDKKQMADSTISFIDDRLKLVFAELSGIEKEIEGFKTTNKLTDVAEQAHLLVANTSEYVGQLTGKEVDLSVVESLEQYLQENINTDRIVPSSLVMQDPSFVSLIQRYNETLMQRDKMLMSLQPTHPSILTINDQLKNLRLELLSSISSVKKGLQVTIGELKKRTAGLERQIGKVPATERIALDYSRQQAIKQELYLFLLKKREETAISKSSTLSNARVIDYAQSDAGPFKPQRKNFILLGLLAGLVIPLAIYFIKELFNNRVGSLNDITQATTVPILAEIGHNENESDVAVTLTARSLISEQFRALRTNVKFLLPNENDKVILITSSMSGEGKSFLSINLSAALALGGKKVILLELDLRKPKISDSLKLNKAGLTNYFIESDSHWEKWIQSYGKDAKFDILSSGPLPPNPAELLMLPKVTLLLSELRKVYDYIIMDSAPVGLVTDGEILASLADATLYLVRHGLTFKQQISLIDKLNRKKSLPRLNIVVNDVVVKKAGYGYDGYGYGYGYGVYGDNEKGA